MPSRHARRREAILFDDFAVPQNRSVSVLPGSATIRASRALRSGRERSRKIGIRAYLQSDSIGKGGQRDLSAQARTDASGMQLGK